MAKAKSKKTVKGCSGCRFYYAKRCIKRKWSYDPSEKIKKLGGCDMREAE